MFIKQLTLLLFVLTSVQTLISQTTEEEFRYTIYGYQEQLIKGMDDKKGYFWRPISAYRFTDTGGRIMKKSITSQFDFIALFREGTDRPCAFVCTYKEQLNLPVEEWSFIGMVAPDSAQNVIAMAEKYLTDEIAFESHLAQKHQLALSHFAMVLSQTENYLTAIPSKNYEGS